MCNYVELLLDAPANINAEIREIGGGCQIYIINHYVMVYEYYEYEGSNLRKKDKCQEFNISLTLATFILEQQCLFFFQTLLQRSRPSCQRQQSR